MKRSFYVSLLSISFLLIQQLAMASTPASRVAGDRDTTVLPGIYQLNEQQFMDRYGKDDSSRALISLFFRKRGSGIGKFAVGTGVAVASGIAGGINLHKAGEDNGTLNDAAAGLAFIFAMFAGIALAIVGSVSWGRYSRQRLLLLLNNYFQGKSIPYGIKKNRMFRGFVQFGNWNEDAKDNLKKADREEKIRRSKQ